jgi:hypothetical protein
VKKCPQLSVQVLDKGLIFGKKSLGTFTIALGEYVQRTKAKMNKKLFDI